MFALAGEITGDQFRVCRIIGNYQYLGGTGKQIDTDATKQDTLGFSDESISRANQDSTS